MTANLIARLKLLHGGTPADKQGKSIELRQGQFLPAYGGDGANIGGIIEHFIDTALDRSSESRTYAIEYGFDHSRAGAVGVLFDDASWSFCNLYVDEEIAFVLENTGVPPNEMPGRVRDVLDVVGLPGFERRKISTLSGGELRRVAIASILVGRPNLIISDDLNGHLDLAAFDRLEAVLDDYVNSNCACWIDFRRRWSEFGAPSETFATVDGSSLVLHPPRGFNLEESVAGEPFGVELARHLGAELGSEIPHFATPRSAVSWLSENQIKLTSQATDRVAGIATVTASSLSFAYQKAAPILSDLNIQLRAGWVYALGGKNGAGKSTLARLLCGLLKPNSGSIEILNAHATPAKLNRCGALVFQKPEYQFIADSVEGELSIALADGGRSEGSVNKPALLKFAETFDIDRLMSRHPFSLGIGDKRRLAVACAIASSRRLIIVDEPTLGQDETRTRMLGAQLQLAAANGCAVLVITHDPEFIAGYCDQVLWLEGGSISEIGQPEKVFASNSGSMFAGKSHLLNFWELSIRKRLAMGRPPRLLADLEVEL